MSNVLIGIIGVILFIGLALAGALFLGPRFQEASSNSTASSVSGHLQQYAHAISLYNVDTGRSFLTNDSRSLLVPGYLKSQPVNPTDATRSYNLGDGEGRLAVSAPVKEIWTVIGYKGDARARATCIAIERQAGNSNPEAIIDTAVNYTTRVAAAPRLGCLLDQDGNGYSAYIRV